MAAKRDRSHLRLASSVQPLVEQRRRDCTDVSEALAAAARGGRALDSTKQEHLGTCLRCRAEQLRYQRLMKALHQLREAPVGDGSRIETQVLAYLASHESQPQRRLVSVAVIKAGGLVAGLAAVAGIVTLAARSRRPRVAA